MIYDGNLIGLAPLIDFLGVIFEGWIEFTLHDLSKPGKTIIAIKNGEITNRVIGDSISDFTQRAVNENVRNEADFEKLIKEVNSVFPDIKSKDLLIRGSEGEIRGILSVNISMGPINQIRRVVDLFSPCKNENVQKENHEVESFYKLAEAIVEDILSKSNISMERLNSEERQEIIAKLKKEGVFQMKGIVSLVAQRMNISEASVYRYLGNL